MKTKGLILYWIFALCFLATGDYVNAQSAVSQSGTEFWVGIGSRSTTSNLRFFITSEHNTTIELRTLDTIVTRNITAGNVEEIILNAGLYSTLSINSSIQNKGIQVTSASPINLYVAGEREAFSDATYVLPKSFIGPFPTYILNRSTQTFNNNSLIVVATEDSTEIVISNPPPGFPNSVFLNRFQTLGIPYSHTQPIQSLRCGLYCKPFAVYYHNSSTQIGGCGALEPLYTQALPEDKLGSDYIITPYMNQSAGYIYSILATQNNTVVQLNDTTITLNRGQQFESEAGEDQVICVQSNEPISIFQLLKGRNCQLSNVGDPAVVELVPMDRRIKRYQHQTMNGDGIVFHYINIVVKKEHTTLLRINGAPVNPNLFMPDSFCNEYKVYRAEVAPGDYTIENDSGFVGYGYGYGNGESYIYTMGVIGESFEFDFELTQTGFCPGDSFFVQKTGDSLTDIRFESNNQTIEGSSAIFVYEEPGTYEIVMRANPPDQPCFIRVSKTVVIQGPSDVLPPDTAVCGNFSITLKIEDTERLTSYTWSESQAIPSDSLIVTSGGTYYLAMTDTFGCAYTDTFRVTQAAVPELTFEYTDTFCQGSVFELKNTRFDDGIAYRLELANETYFLQDSFINVLLSDTGVFNGIFYGMLEDACGDSANVLFYVAPVPTADLFISPPTQCLRNAEVSIINQSSDFNHPLWVSYQLDSLFLEGPNADFLPTDTGTYRVTQRISNPWGCTDSTESNFRVFPQSSFRFNPTSACLGDPIEIPLLISDSGAVPDSIFWNTGDGNTLTGSTLLHTYSQVGSYNVWVHSITQDGCLDTFFLDNGVQIWSLPVADFSFEKTIDSGDFTGFQFSDLSITQHAPLSYNWTFDRFGNSDQANPLALFNDTGRMSIILEVSDSNGCSDTRMRTLTTYPNTNLYFPNVFSPNNDGINDIYMPVGGRFTLFYNLKIYSRWGELIFESDDPLTGWDGTLSGKPAPVQTYMYTAKFTTLFGETVEKRGTFNLVR